MTQRSSGRPAVVAVVLAMLAGCGGPAGPARYRVSGTVTCGGVAVPHGEILFSPDGSRGNTGPQGIAIIGSRFRRLARRQAVRRSDRRRIPRKLASHARRDGGCGQVR